MLVWEVVGYMYLHTCTELGGGGGGVSWREVSGQWLNAVKGK